MKKVILIHDVNDQNIDEVSDYINTWKSIEEVVSAGEENYDKFINNILECGNPLSKDILGAMFISKNNIIAKLSVDELKYVQTVITRAVDLSNKVNATFDKVINSYFNKMNNEISFKENLKYEEAKKATSNIDIEVLKRIVEERSK